MAVDERTYRIPQPSEDDQIADEPSEGMTDDPVVAAEEGVPWDPPTERIVADERDPGDELEADDSIQAVHPLPRDDHLRTDVIEALRASDIPAGDRLRVAATGSTVFLFGHVASIEVLNEILGIAGDVPGVEDVVDEVEIEGV